MLDWQPFVKNSYIKFHEKPTSGLVADVRYRRADAVSNQALFFFVLKEYLKMERSAWANYCLTNEDGTDSLSRNVGKQLPTLCNIPEKRRPQLHNGGSLKPRIIRGNLLKPTSYMMYQKV
jgi:hypothetical protein